MAMEYRRLGESGLEVSALCLGTMMFGVRTEAADAQRIIDTAFDQGVNFIDTADAYGKGAAERIVGAAIKAQRRRWIVATKVFNPMTERPHDGGLSRRWIMQACADSLERLSTDWIDIYYLHRDFNGMDLEEPLRAIDALLAAGKIRSWGISNFRGWRIADVVHTARALNMAPPVVCQPYYNLLNRMPEVEVLPACAAYGIGVVPYSPIARGVLSGKYAPGAKPAENTRAGRGDKRILETEFRAESLRAAQELKAHCATKGVSLSHFATAWVLAHRAVSAVIAGPRTFEQWTSYLGAVDYVWTAEDEKLADSLVVPGHASTPGFTDPAYPVEGRFPQIG